MEHDIDKVIGSNLSRLRAIAGLKQGELGDLLPRKLVAQQISKYELGINQASAARLFEFAAVLQCDITDFFTGLTTDQVDVAGKRGDLELMTDYHKLSPNMQTSVRALVHAAAKE